jgi:hypothetical protein
VTRPRLAKLAGLAREAGASLRRQRMSRTETAAAPPPRELGEVARRLDATRERLRRDVPPVDHG